MSGRSPRTVPAVLAVVVVVLALVVAVLGVEWVRDAQQEQARAEGLAAARALTERVLSVDPGAPGLPPGGEVGGRFAAGYERIAAGLRAARERGVTIRTTVVRAGVDTVEETPAGTRVRAAVWAEQVPTAGTGPALPATSPRFSVVVERDGERWRIVELEPV